MRPNPDSTEFRELSPFQQLVWVMAALRSPQGCPWDLQQDHQTLKRYLLEETYETLEAIEDENFPEMCEELGDLLLQIVFHAQLAKEAGHFQIDDVCRAIVGKMLRRHPHVFGPDEKLETSEAVLERWDELKKGEGKSQSVLSGLPRTLPSLQRAERLQARAARVGFDFPDVDSAWKQLEEEFEELESTKGSDDKGAKAEELGDVLFACVSVARKLGIDPEAALRSTCDKFQRRFHAVESTFGEGIKSQPVEELVRVWKEQP